MRREVNELRQKQVFRRRLYSIPVLLILIFILSFLIHGTWGVYLKSKESGQRLEVAEESVFKLESRKEKVSNEIERLNSETGIEEEIRSKFNVAKSDEDFVIIVNNKEVPVVDEPEKGFKKFWKSLFFWKKD